MTTTRVEWTVKRPRFACHLLWQRLEELGWVQGKNLLIDAHWRDGRVERLPALVDEVIARKVDVLITSGTPAARNATSKVVKG
jgi:putative tryptophan/tyrosine transport system substrate-binding protein